MTIGLYAPVGSGKSTLLKIFAENGWTALDQDRITHSLLIEESKTLARLFGEGILDHGQVCRKKLSALVFGDASQRQRLEDFLYPLIHQRTHALMKGSTIVEGVNLYRVLDHYSFDKTLTITLPLALLRERLLKRGHSPQWIESVLKAQEPLFAAQAKADIRLSNAGTLLELEQAARTLISRWD